MQKPPVTDAEFQVIDHKGPGLGALVFWFLWMAGWCAAVYHANAPWERVTCMILALIYPGIGKLWLMLMNPQTVSYEQSEWLRQRMNPQLSWRKRAIPRHR